jgi:hypothetical protein
MGLRGLKRNCDIVYRVSAWEETDYEQIWTPFDAKFNFRPSMESFPGYTEPVPSVTYDIASAYGNEKSYNALEADLYIKLLKSFRELLQTGEYVWALDWQHQTYKFFPHREFLGSDPEQWKVPLFPNGDYYIFLEKGMEWGVLGHPWEKTMCVFGEKLITSISVDPPTLFSRVHRRDGKK